MRHIAGRVGHEDLYPVASQTFVDLCGDVSPFISDRIRLDKLNMFLR
jgi:hypothetical protein